jgi:XTP/dITP diphosphohydrolase
MRLILASQNPGKHAEMRALLKDLRLELLVPEDFDRQLEIQETGVDYAANALIKARAFAGAFGHWTLGDDTGLEVEALGGAPGIRSARILGAGSDDRGRRLHLLELLSEHPRPWRARFVSVVALVSPQGEVELRRGECPGEIIPQERGEQGFGYDPIFLVGETGKTMAELTMGEKNRLSHRALAVQAIIPVIALLADMEGA